MSDNDTPYAHRCIDCNKLERDHHQFRPNLKAPKKCAEPDCHVLILDGPEYSYCTKHDPVMDLIS